MHNTGMQKVHIFNPTVYNYIYIYSITSTPIEKVQATKYLGLTITKDLSWSTHVDRALDVILHITSKRALSVKAFFYILFNLIKLYWTASESLICPGGPAPRKRQLHKYSKIS